MAMNMTAKPKGRIVYRELLKKRSSQDVVKDEETFGTQSYTFALKSTQLQDWHTDVCRAVGLRTMS